MMLTLLLFLTLSTTTSLTQTPPSPPVSLDPLLLRACRGESVERTPVWMMRQAGRHLSSYRTLCTHHPTFRERSETPELAVEISLQPMQKYHPDGCIVFSDILTPLPGMGVEFHIEEGKGPVVQRMSSWEDVRKMHPLDPTKSTPFLATILQTLRHELPPTTTLLGFIGCPYTLASYILGHSLFPIMYTDPTLLHTLLSQLSQSLLIYALYQIEHGAQVVQLFDTWAGKLAPVEYEVFAAPYQKWLLEGIREVYPEVPTILYVQQCGNVLESMVETNVNVLSLDWTVDIAKGRERIREKREALGWKGEGILQGNLDPRVLRYGNEELVRERTVEILNKMGGKGHVMNLGHGIDKGTSEENALCFMETVREFRHGSG